MQCARIRAALWETTWAYVNNPRLLVRGVRWGTCAVCLRLDVSFTSVTRSSNRLCVPTLAIDACDVRAGVALLQGRHGTPFFVLILSFLCRIRATHFA